MEIGKKELTRRTIMRAARGFMRRKGLKTRIFVMLPRQLAFPQYGVQLFCRQQRTFNGALQTGN